MTTADIPELIAEARGFAAGSDSARATLMRDLADALEAVTAENESLRRFDWLKRNRGVEAERDEALSVIADARSMHQPKKIWESDRAYTLVCTHCELRPYPCATARILSRIPEHPKED